MTLSGNVRKGIDSDARDMRFICKVLFFSLGFGGWIIEQLGWAFEGELKGKGCSSRTMSTLCKWDKAGHAYLAFLLWSKAPLCETTLGRGFKHSLSTTETNERPEF